MFQRNLNQIWEQLRGKSPQFKHFLQSVRIENLRGIRDLSIQFKYPVTVIAGPNGCGKSTVLYSCACAYRVEGAGLRDFFPSAIFPNLTIDDNLQDKPTASNIDYTYLHENKFFNMRWSRKKSWDKSFFGRKQAVQPERALYLRTLANLTSPSEVRGVLTIAKKDFTTEDVTVDQIAFARRILGYNYSTIKAIKSSSKDLLFAARDNGAMQYSEFHMSAGERALLRLSREISSLQNALVLIDEIEAGLHPYTQQQIMLELQRLALRNNLQIIVTTHSPVILECVPIEGKVFLERTDDNVIQKSAYRTIIQKAYYGQTLDRLSILCEDDVGEAFVRGVLDCLNPKLELIQEDIEVGRDTGKTEFPAHIRALHKFSKLADFLFVLDGNARSMETEIKAAAPGEQVRPIFLPGDSIPEAWCWKIMENDTDTYALKLGIAAVELKQRMARLSSLYQAAADKQTQKDKQQFFDLATSLGRSTTDLVRLISRQETEQGTGDIVLLVQDLENQIRDWLARK